MLRQVRIADGKGKEARDLAGVTVIASGGVPAAWAALTQYLPRSGSTLDIGSWQGLAALWLLAAGNAETTYAHVSSAALARAMANAAASGLELDCRAMFPLEGEWHTIILAAPAQKDALAMFMEQVSACLHPGGQILVVDEQGHADGLEEYCSSVKVLAGKRDWQILRCLGPRSKGPVELPWYSLQAPGPDGAIGLCSLPGNFSPLAVDRGTLALLAEARIPPGGRVLDLACGYGVVGIVAACRGAGQVVYVDDDLTALCAVRHNLQRLGLQGQVVHSHCPGAVPGRFDCILVNPPYHCDYGTARSFLEFAARRLREGGWLYVVVKKPDWYANKLRTLFGGYWIGARDGYAILAAQQRPRKAAGEKAAKTTRKHKRRQAAAKGRGKQYG